MPLWWLAAALVLQALGADDAAAGGRARASPVYIGPSSELTCRPGPRRRYQVGRRCVWGRSPVLTLRVPSRRDAAGRNAAYTAQVPGNLKRSAGPLGREPPCPPYLAAQLKCSTYTSSDPFVRALIDNPSPSTQPTLDAFGIPAIPGVPPIVIINPNKVGPDGAGSGGDLVFNGAGSGDLIFNGVGSGDLVFNGVGSGGDLIFNGIGSGGDLIFNGVGSGGDLIFNGLP